MEADPQQLATLGPDEQTKRRARIQAAAAIRAGKLVPQPCEVCLARPFRRGRQFVQAHHEDYLRPLEVRWLCPRHHRERTAALERFDLLQRRERRHGFGVWLRNRRREVGLTQRGLARLLGVSADSISDWERGRAFPLRERLPAIEAVLQPAEHAGS